MVGEVVEAGVPSRDDAGDPIVVFVVSHGGLADAVSASLASNGFSVHVASHAAAHQAVAERRPALVLVERLSETGGTTGVRVDGLGAPVVVIGHNRLDEVVEALDGGAAAYVANPQRGHELAARLRAVLRRAGSRPPADPPSVVTAGDLQVDLGGGTVAVGPRVVRLPSKDLLALAFLASRAGCVVTHEELARRIWGMDQRDHPRVVSDQIRRIRARIEDDDAAPPTRLLAIRGVGYRLVPH